MEAVKVRKHQWSELSVTSVEVLVDTDGSAVVVSRGAESQVTVGCFVCHMGLEEGFEVSCPGQDLFEEEE